MPVTQAQLDRSRKTVAATLTDVCTITYDAGGEHDDVFDPDRLTLTPPVDDALTIYGPAVAPHAGACTVAEIAASSAEPQQYDEGGQVRAERRYRLVLPHDAPVIAIGAIVEVNTSADVQLVGQRYEVIEIVRTSRQVSRRFMLRQRYGAEQVRG